MNEQQAQQDFDTAWAFAELITEKLRTNGLDIDGVECDAEGDSFRVHAHPWPPIFVVRDSLEYMATDWQEQAQAMVFLSLTGAKR